MKNVRYHSLDACRSVMLLLGLVLHASLTYAVFTVELSSLPVDNPYHFGWHFVDGSSHWFIDQFYMFIHTFRMPVFFLLAGFFSSMMVVKYGSKTYLIKRLIRIGIPFLLAWGLIIPLERQTAFVVNAIAGGREQYIADHAWRGYMAEIWNNTGAFWFLYYLLIISLITFILVRAGKGGLRLNLKSHQWIYQSKVQLLLLPLILVGLSILFLSFSSVPYLPDDQDFIPDLYLLATYGLFYGLGWFWYSHQKPMFELAKYYWILLAVGTFTFIFYMRSLDVFFNTGNSFTKTNILHAITMWTLSLGMLGLFNRLTSKPSKFWRYISDSSYFVYIIHVPVFLFFQGYISFLNWGAIPKLLLCLVCTTLSCLILYHVLARHSVVGYLLNGKKYSWRTGEVVRVVPAKVRV